MNFNTSKSSKDLKDYFDFKRSFYKMTSRDKSNIITKNKYNNECTDIHKREAAFFGKIAENILSLPKEEQQSFLRVDLRMAINNYPDYYQYAYKLLGDINGKNILDMGCGTGKSSVILAKKGAFVTSFDVSDKYVEVTKLRAKVNNMDDKIKAEQMIAENMKYDSESFDVVFGVGILHHVDIEATVHEISRVMKNEGKAIFIEPIAFNPVLRKIRNLSMVKTIVPNKGKNLLITEDESQIDEKDIEFFRTIFKTVHYRAFQIFSRLDRFIGGYPVRRWKKIIFIINWFDRVLLNRFHFLSTLGRWGVIQLIK